MYCGCYLAQADAVFHCEHGLMNQVARMSTYHGNAQYPVLAFGREYFDEPDILVGDDRPIHVRERKADGARPMA